MPLYRNHFRRSRDAPGVNRDLLHSTSKGREVNRTHIDVGRAADDSWDGFLHPTLSGIIQTFCNPC